MRDYKELLKAGRLVQRFMSTGPVNYQRRDLARIQADVDYAVNHVSVFCRLFAQCGLSVDGLRFLEVGPGTDFGAQLILASMGAKVTLADRFLAHWDDDYHPEFYRKLAERWDGPKHCLEATIEAGGYADQITLIEEAAEDIASVADGSVDLVYSNAVLEHIYDPAQVANEFARVLRIDGHSIHQIDMRDHRDFSRPIEHLLLSENAYEALAVPSHFECGNRYRSMEFWAYFENAGLCVTERDISAEAPSEYQQEALSRLRKSPSPYRNWPAEDVFRTGGRFFLKKVDSESAAVLRERASDALAIMEALKQMQAAPPKWFWS